MSSEKTRLHTPIAIVGLGSMFPGRGTDIGYWRDILEARDVTSDVPETHWRVEDYYDPDPKTPDMTYSKRGAFIPSFAFDPIEFGTAPAVVQTTDTVQLIALYVAKRVLAEATRTSFDKFDTDRTSVILGVAAGTELIGDMASRLNRPIWLKAMKEAGISEDEAGRIAENISSHYGEWNESTFPGLLGNVVAGRIANRLNLNGTNMTADAACASSLAAVKYAMQELWLGDSDLVLTGGSDALNNIFMYMCFSKTPAMSPTGYCRPFSDDADGTLMGEGCGILALRRLEDAERDGNTIYGVISGIGSSSDGSGTAVYAPRAGGQALALKRAYEMAGYSPRTVELIEAHGTGTRAGDAAEFNGLSETFNAAADGSKAWCALGSVKSQIGHTKSAAGAAGLIKAVLALHHKVLPPTVNINKPNPKLAIEDSPFYLNTKALPWFKAEGEPPRRASVSSFGFGGSNFHVALEEYTGAGQRPAKYRTSPAELFLFSASSAESLRESIEGRVASIAADADLPHHSQETLHAFKAADQFRLSIVASSLDELKQTVGAVLPIVEKAKPFSTPDVTFETGPTQPGQIGFVFSGQGSQYLGMGGDLAMQFDCAREAWEHTDAATPEGLELPSKVVFCPEPFDDAKRADQLKRLTATQNAQPAIAAMALSHMSVLAGLGILPAVVTGHSFGELMALHSAGVFNEASVVKIAHGRGGAMAQVASGADAGMLAVMAGKETVEPVLSAANGEVVIANDNSPGQVILSGTKAALAVVAERLVAMKLQVRELPVSTAFHSPIVAAAARIVHSVIAGQGVHEPSIPVYANTTASPYPSNVESIIEIVAEQIAKPVRFRETIEHMHADGVRTFIEVGPKSVLTKLIGQILADKPHVSVALDDGRENGMKALMRAVGRLCVSGLPVQTDFLFKEAPAPAPLPVPKKHALYLNGANYRKPYPPKVEKREAEAPVRKESAVLEVTGTTETVQTTAGQSAVLPVAQPLAAPTPPAAPVPVAATPAPVAPAPAPVAASPAAVANDVSAIVRDIVSEKTGYPAEMLDLDMDLEGELGIDSIKQVEVLSTLRERMPDMLEIEPSRLSELRTLNQIAAAIGGAVTAPAQVASVAPAPAAEIVAQQIEAPAPVAAAPASVVGDVSAIVRDIVSEKTGYPAEMLDLDMDLEGELGIDSIKQVEVLSTLRERMPDMPEIEPSRLSELRTLNQIAAAIGSAAPAPVEVAPIATAPAAEVAQQVEAPAPVAAAPASVVGDVSAIVRDIVSEKTGYPAEMLDLDMDLEGELGIDSIKQVEVLSTLRERMPDMPEIEPSRLSELRTLNQIAAAIGSAAPAPVEVAPVAPAPAAEVAPQVEAPVPVAAMPVVGDISAIVRDIVSEKTGYPAEMLDLDMDLEGELGIDSIKQVEVLSTLRERMPDMPEIEPSRLSELRTLNQIAAAIGSAAPAPVEVAPIATAPAAEVAPQVEAPVPVAAMPVVGDISAIVRDIVSEKTGYPAEMLDLDMDLEGELGIDSIKQVEVLSTLRERMPDMPEIEPSRLSELRTLNQIAAAIGSAAPLGVSVSDAKEATKVTLGQSDYSGSGLYRQRVELEHKQASRQKSRWLGPDKRIALTNCEPRVADALAAGLRKNGLDVSIIHPDEADKFDTLIVTSGLSENLSKEDVHLAALRAASKIAPEFSTKGGAFITLQDTGGDFGRTMKDVYRASKGGLTGLVKTARHEWPNASCKAIDIERRHDEDGNLHPDTVQKLIEEILQGGEDVEVGLTSDGRRLVPVCVLEPATDEVSQHQMLDEGSVVIVSGGGRGITAQTVIELAKKKRLKFALLGRSPLVDTPAGISPTATEEQIRGDLSRMAAAEGRKVSLKSISSQAARIIASREIRSNLAILRNAGSEAEYYPVDVADMPAVMHVCSVVRSKWGPISGIIHGAGQLADKLIKDKTEEQFKKVFTVKVRGIHALLAGCSMDPLKFVALFSSIAGRFGNPGQADYAMANEALNRTAWAIRNSRPDCFVVAINWGPWDGGMVSDGIRAAFEERGIQIIPEHVGTEAFVREALDSPDGHPEVVFAGLSEDMSAKLTEAA
ncbi:SDR family NAD(P)-dependent oxidoreductase [Hoeflea sp. CAU 1731]